MGVTKFVSASGKGLPDSANAVILTQLRGPEGEPLVELLIGDSNARLCVDEAQALANRLSAAACWLLDGLPDFAHAS